MPGHIVVCGEDALAVRIIGELTDAGLTVVRLRSPSDLAGAGVAAAEAVVCASAEDAVNLEVALLAREANPEARVVARLSNAVLREAMAEDNGPGAVLDVADLAAPAVVEALLGRATHPITVAGTEFVVAGQSAPRHGRLDELYPGLVPVAVLRGEHAGADDVVAAPPRDQPVARGDWTVLIGTTAELTAHDIAVSAPIPAGPHHRSRRTRAADALRALHHDVHPMFYWVLGIAAGLLVGSTVLLRLSYQQDRMSWLDAFYFSTETLTTTGFGDYSFIEQPSWLRLWAVAMMLLGAVGSAFIVAFAADVLLSRRLLKSASAQKASHLRRHHVVVGLGAFGTRVAAMLRADGHDVVVVECDEENRYVGGARELGVPVIFGDATMPDTLRAAQAGRAASVAVLTEDDMVNIETAIVAREILADAGRPADGRRVPVVMRIYDRALGHAVAGRFGFTFVRSTVDLATPWFLGAAMGLEVLGTFSIGQRSFMVGAGEVQPESDLDRTRVGDIAGQVIAVSRPGAGLRVHPARDDLLGAGDTVYLVGPFREVLADLRRGGHRTRAPVLGPSHR